MNKETKIAIENLNEGYTCVMANEGEIKCFTERGVAPLLSVYPNEGRGGCFADKVVGKAAAYLYVLLSAREVFAKTVSEGALKILQKYEIPVEYEKSVPAIINRTGDDLCPLEKALSSEYEPFDALAVITETLKKLKGN